MFVVVNGMDDDVIQFVTISQWCEQIGLRSGKQTVVHLPICRKPDSIAIIAKRIGNGAYNTETAFVVLHTKIGGCTMLGILQFLNFTETGANGLQNFRPSHTFVPVSYTTLMLLTIFRR